jgi:hypothetical protein
MPDYRISIIDHRPIALFDATLRLAFRLSYYQQQLIAKRRWRDIDAPQRQQQTQHEAVRHRQQI